MTLMQVRQPIVFQPQGRLDLQGGTALSTEMATTKPQPGELRVIDLTAVDFIDSSGLVALVTGLKAAREIGYRLVLCGVQAPVRLIFELTQLDSVFEIFDCYEDVISNIADNSVIFAA